MTYPPYLQECRELQHPGPPLRRAHAHATAALNLNLENAYSEKRGFFQNGKQGKKDTPRMDFENHSDLL